MAPRSQPYRVEYPLNADQARNIDEMFQILFDDIRNGSLIITLPDQVTGVLNVIHGGTGKASWVVGDIVYATATTVLAGLTIGSVGKIIRSTGTLPAYSSFTIPDTFAQGDIIYGSASNVLTALAKNTSATRYLSNTGAANNPAWAQVDLTNGVTGTLPVGNGGTGTATTFTQGSVIFAGASGIYSQNNSGFNWDNSTIVLKVGGANPSITLAGTEGSAHTYAFKEIAGVLQINDTTSGAPFIKFRDNANFEYCTLQLAGTVIFTVGNSTRGLQFVGSAAGGAADPYIGAQSGSNVHFWSSSSPVMSVGSSNVVQIYGASTDSVASSAAVLKINGGPGLFSAKFLGSQTASNSFGLRVSAGTNTSDVAFSVLNATEATDYLRVRGDGNFGVRTAGNTITAYVHIGAGTASASTAPLKFTSGTSLTSAEAGAIEFTTDDLFFTITTGAARKGIILDNGSRLTSGKIPIATTNGRLIDLTASSAYTPTNVTTDRSYDANATSLDELADVLGTVIADLQTKGILG